MTPPPPLPVAGWTEHVDLPELGVQGLLAKLDTGARTSALHAERLATIAPRFLRVHLPLPGGRLQAAELELVDEIWVRTSGGQRVLRPVIETLLVVGPLRRRVRITLADRSDMRAPMILGRSALAGGLVVDASRRHLLAPRRARRADPGGPRPSVRVASR